MKIILTAHLFGPPHAHPIGLLRSLTAKGCHRQTICSAW